MDDKNIETTTESAVKAPQDTDSQPVVNESTTNDSTAQAVDTTTTEASAPAADSNPAVSSVTASQPAEAVATPTITTMGGGETQTMAETTKKIDPKFDGCEAYVVQKGDALVDIANKYNVGLNQLRYFNGVPKATFKISEGQTIYIPKGEVKVPVGA